MLIASLGDQRPDVSSETTFDIGLTEVAGIGKHGGGLSEVLRDFANCSSISATWRTSEGEALKCAARRWLRRTASWTLAAGLRSGFAGREPLFVVTLLVGEAFCRPRFNLGLSFDNGRKPSLAPRQFVGDR